MDTEPQLRKRRAFNFWMFFLHAAQGVAVLALSVNFKLPVTASFLRFETPTQSLVANSGDLFQLSLPLLVAAFFFISAFAHLSIATYYNRAYNANLLKGINKARWWEYAFSASIMLIAIAMLVGVYDLGELILVFGLGMVMNFMGLMMEVHNQGVLARGEKPNWLSFKIGSLAGVIPWLVIALSFWAGAHFDGSRPPAFVYWIYVSIFIFFNCFAVNMILQYKKVGKWSDYLYGERAYIILSLVAKSLLAWQIFAGTLRP